MGFWRNTIQIIKRQCIILACAILCWPTAIYTQNIIEVGGIFTENQLWTNENEYHVVDNVRILLDAELRIESGTVVKFNQGRGLSVEGGQLIVLGTQTDTVRMMANHQAGESWNWSGISIVSVNQPGSAIIHYAHIQHALVGLRSISSSNLVLQNSRISDNRNVGVRLFNSSFNLLQNNIIGDNFLGLEIYASGPGNFSQYNQIIQNTYQNTTTNILIHNNNHGGCSHNNIEENLIDGGVHGIWLFNSTSQGGTGHITINRNIIINNGTTNDGYGIYVSMDSTIITHNIFWKNTNALSIIEAQKTHFLNNSIYENKRGITMRTNASDVGLLNNTITSTGEYALRINDADEVLIAQNNIFGSLADSSIIQNFSTQQIQIANNYWGTTNDSILERLFFTPGNDLVYKPVLPLPNIDAPVSPPCEVVAQLINDNVRLRWKSNPESDLLGYHVYAGDFEGYSFAQDPIFVLDTFYLLPASSLNGFIAVTALDEDGLQNAAQLSGHESPFSFAKPLPYAGENLVVCENVLLVSLTQSTMPSGFSGLRWLSRGDGIFENANDLRTWYFPGEQDLQKGRVTLVLTAGHDGSTFYDSLNVNFERQARIFIGNQAIIRTDSLYKATEATAEHFSSLWWSSTGDGSFDRADSLETVYTPGPNDLLNGQVMLILQAFSAYCETVSDTMLLIIKNAWSVEGRLWADQVKLGLNPVIAVKTDQFPDMQTHYLTYTDQEGRFRFESLFEGNYQFFAPIDTIGMESYLPSYYVNSNRWQDAYQLFLAGNTFDMDLHLVRTLSPLPFGDGSLKGHFSLEGFGRENSETYCRPWFDASGQDFCNDGLSNATVLLFGASRERIYAHTLTDANGNFFFNKLPFGDYVIEVEMAGYESAVSETIMLSPERNTVADIILQIEGEKKIGIYLPRQNQNRPQVQAYPNPTTNKVFINTLAFESDRTLIVNIYSIEGRLVQATQAKTSNQALVLDMSGMKAGLYLIKLTDGEKEVVFLQGKK